MSASSSPAAAGFLGSHLVERLERDGRRRRSSPRSADYDLTRWDDAERLFADAEPELVFHLAAEVGGIGANRAEPRALLVREPDDGRARARAEPRSHDVAQARHRSARSARTRSSRRCRSARTTSGTATRRRRTRPTASRRRRCSSARRPTASSTGTNAIFLLPVNLYGPRDNFDPTNAHVIPALIRKMHESPRRRSCSGATARRRASSSTSRTAPRRSCSRPSATTAPSRSTSAPARRSRSASSPSWSPS